MNGLSRNCQHVIRIICFTTITSLFCFSAQASDPFEVMMHDADIYGTRDIEAGNYAKGVQRLLTQLGDSDSDSRQAASIRTPIVIDLCAGYTMLEDIDAATRYCDEAVASGWSKGLALNNRGALHVRKGDYKNAILDFQASIEARGANRIASRNLDRIEARVAALLHANDRRLAQTNPNTD